MTNFTLAIVGGGPNCLYLLERLYATTQCQGNGSGMTVRIFDQSGAFGSGCHYSSQPTTNHLNRVADQISFGADESNAEQVTCLLAPWQRWTLYDWCRERYAVTHDERYFIDRHDWVDRALFGEASEAVFRHYVDGLLALGVEVVLTKARVVDLGETDAGWRVSFVEHGELQGETADYAILCTGHGPPMATADSFESLCMRLADAGGIRYTHNIYPLEALDAQSAPAGSTVLCRGMGLAALDVLLRLTQGRGGYFHGAADTIDGLRYVRSGFEPKAILPFSDSGVFIYTRAYNQKLNDRTLFYQGRVFTPDAVRRMREVVRERRPDQSIGAPPQLDFDAHVMPLIVAEMTIAYYGTLYGRDFGAAVAERVESHVAEYMVTAVGMGPDAEKVLLASARAHIASLEQTLAGALLGNFPDERAVDGRHRACARAFLRFRLGAEAIAELDMNAPHLPFWTSARDLVLRVSPWEHDSDPRSHRFDWAAIADPLATPGVEDDAALRWLRRDIHNAMQGNLDNPTKAAIDGVWRDCRDAVREAVEFGGLTAASHAIFETRYRRLVNRLAVGTSLKIMRRIYALARDRVVDLSVSRRPRYEEEVHGVLTVHAEDGRHTRKVDAVVNACVHKFDIRRTTDALYRKLHERGTLRPWTTRTAGQPDFCPGGIDIARPTPLAVRLDGRTHTRLAALGTPTEGAFYFHLAAMRPYCADLVIVDAEHVIRHALDARRTIADHLESAST
ncbi:FAD/NAD(P)-binding protein [Burkholderia sp. JSH-S8]|nr:FAD/NAD(P)-binding protein [Burkholderia sp. JSH-S8]